MPDWMSEGRTAVITGGAGGIGLESARRYIKAGMNVAIADLKDELADAHKDLVDLAGGDEARVYSEKVDVTSIDQLTTFRDNVLTKFGKVHCLMGNAGIIAAPSKPWEGLEMAEKILGINMMGVVKTCQVFIPSMLEHGESGAVINTGSKQGITRPPGNYAYNISKTTVLAYTEALAHGFLNEENCKLKAHLLVPAFVYTPLISQFIPQKPDFAATTEETVDYFMDALARDEFYIICPDGETNRQIDEKRIQWTMEDIIKNRPAMSRWHPDYEDAFKKHMEDVQ